ncbi:MAG: AAA family ATPase [Thermoplasmatales archaeon]
MIPSFSSGVNSLIGGGYKENIIYSLYGLPNTGKTLFVIQEIGNFLKNKYRVLWIDTEGGGQAMIDAWAGKFFDIKNENLYYNEFLVYEDVMRYLGYEVEVLTDKKKTEVNMVGEIKKDIGVNETFGRLKNNTAIVVDSITSLFRLRFSDSSQNFSARATATGYLIFALEKLAKKTNAVLLFTHHASLNPTNPYQTLGVMRGGNTLMYYSKYILYIEKSRKKLLSDYRKIYGVRLPDSKEWEKTAWLKITDNGYVDVPESEILALLKGKDEKDED